MKGKHKIKLPEGLERGGSPSPAEVLAWTLETFKPRVIMTTSFGLNGVALIHMAHALDPKLPTIFIDTGYHFEETLETKKRIVERYGLNLVEYRPKPSVEEEAKRAERALYLENPGLCCEKRKVEVFQRALAELNPDALISARSRHQSETRAELSVIDLEARPVQVNPLVDWSHEEIERFVREHNIPYNPLHDSGYPSIGCWPCTQGVEAGADIRSGRWNGTDKKECGIWVEGDNVVRTGRQARDR